MRFHLGSRGFVSLFLLCAATAWAGDGIPKVAWKRPLGEPLANPGTRKPALASSIIDDGYWQGAPVGGFGAGTFSRTYRGDFARWHLKGGVHKYETVYANQFALYEKSEGSSESVAQVLLNDHPKHGELNSWQWDYPVGAGNYYALYPKSWYDYQWDKFPAHVTLEQFSPIIPENYRETSYPVAVYRWHADNPTNHTVTVSVLFSWTNMLGWLRYPSIDFNGSTNAGNENRIVTESLGEAGTMKSVVFDRHRPAGVQDDWDGQFAIAALESPGVEVSYQTTFASSGDGKEVWGPFSKDGRLANSDERWTSSSEALGGAIAVRFTLQPGEKRIVPMVVAWDLPLVEFGEGRKWYRHYTDFFGTTGTNALKIAAEGLKKAQSWSDAIDAWQAPYVNDESKPAWYRGALFNELYIIADGGSFWGRPVDADPKTHASFAFMECFDYPYYSTLDVRFYGSVPLAKFWPEIDKQVLRQFADTVPREQPDRLLWEWKSAQEGKQVFRTRKVKGAVPHDLGAPNEDPFFKSNQFSWQNTNGWKDLNSKFVLMVYRDYVFTGRTDKTFLKYTWPAVQEALQYLRQYDHDGSGLPENDGYPDQTYDVWVVRGLSAYCGGLWLGALRAAEEIAKELGDTASAAKYRDLFNKSQASYIKKLWNGEYFRYDLMSEYKDDIQADQLAGQCTAWGVYHVTYETKGYWFRTPEAYEEDGLYRASMYMRPAAIWALETTPLRSK
jgi:non-lysosomal glucosylceramidase